MISYQASTSRQRCKSVESRAAPNLEREAHLWFTMENYTPISVVLNSILGRTHHTLLISTTTKSR